MKMLKGKRLYLFPFLFTFCFSFGQTVSEINIQLGIPNQLNEKEIRIYKSFDITNGTEIFRIYEDNEKRWISELYKYYHNVNAYEKPRFEKSILQPNETYQLIWLKIQATDIEYLPNWESFEYKLKGKGQFILVDDELVLSRSKTSIMDGVGYKTFVRFGGKANFIDYHNPESYLAHYPEVDELNSFSSLLSVIRNAFNIWKEK
ncbi:MAG: hypothetical protein V4717_02225 [Bacteroidota bacterium]